MRQSLVLTLWGPDRPGLVELLADVVATHGGNWEESRMAHLAGQFAGILHVSVPAPSADELTKALRDLERRGLSVTVAKGEEPSAAEAARPMRLEVVGDDRPGIVRQVSAVLAEQNINVEELSTERSPAPHSGGTLFKATARLRCPPQLGTEQLRERLEAIANDLMVDIHE